MALGARPELVGKRFVCVVRGGEEPLELGEIGQIGRWSWRAGVIRAVSHRDNSNPELAVSGAEETGSVPGSAGTTGARCLLLVLTTGVPAWLLGATVTSDNRHMCSKFCPPDIHRRQNNPFPGHQ